MNGKSFQKQLFLQNRSEVRRVSLGLYDPNTKSTNQLEFELQQNAFLDRCVFDAALRPYLNQEKVDEAFLAQRIELAKKYSVLFKGASFYACRKLLDAEGLSSHYERISLSAPSDFEISIKTLTGKTIKLRASPGFSMEVIK